MPKRSKISSEIPFWEWVVGVIGLVFVLTSIGFMLYQAFVVEEFAPEILIETEAIEPSGSVYLVKIRVTNRGGLVAAGLVVEGILKDGDEIVETSEITIDHVPAGSEREAGLFFARDPEGLDLQLRAKGYQQP